MRDLKFTKDHVYAEFEESENTENIKSGEPLGVVFGKIAKWISESKEWQAHIQEALGTVESGLSEVVDLPESTEVTE